MPGDVDRDGCPVFYARGKLAADLTLPKLQRRWATARPVGPPPVTDPERLEALQNATRSARRIAGVLAGGQADGDSVADAAGELLTAAAEVTGGHTAGGHLRAAADVYEWASRAPTRPTPARVPTTDPAGRILQQAARQLIHLGHIRGRQADTSVVELVVAVVEYHRARGRAAAAAAARTAVEQLRVAVPAGTPVAVAAAAVLGPDVSPGARAGARLAARPERPVCVRCPCPPSRAVATDAATCPWAVTRHRRPTDCQGPGAAHRGQPAKALSQTSGSGLRAPPSGQHSAARPAPPPERSSDDLEDQLAMLRRRGADNRRTRRGQPKASSWDGLLAAVAWSGLLSATASDGLDGDRVLRCQRRLNLGAGRRRHLRAVLESRCSWRRTVEDFAERESARCRQLHRPQEPSAASRSTSARTSRSRAPSRSSDNPTISRIGQSSTYDEAQMRRHRVWLLGGLPVGMLLAAVLAARRTPTAPTPQQPPDQEPTPLAPDEHAEPTDPPPLPRPASHRHRLRAAVAGASIIAGAGLVATIGVATSSLLVPVAIAGAVLVVGFCAFVLPRLLAPTRTPQDLTGIEDLTSKDRIQFADDRRRLQNEIRTGLLQGIGGAALLISLLFTWQQQQTTSLQATDQLEVTRQGQVGERFSRAVEQLGSDKLDVRIGAIYELEQLARAAEDRRGPIIEVLAAYVRQHAPLDSNTQTDAELSDRAADVQTALTVLGRRPPSSSRVDLHQTNLYGADLSGADLGGANLRTVNLGKADLGKADLGGANLSGAYLAYADLSGTDLTGVDLPGADLTKTNLSGTDLGGANLSGGDLDGVPLPGADLTDARANASTIWPSGFDWRKAGVRMLGA